ncbi:hypothetical protein [Qipengyuania sp. JC766]|uniref:hypothetical protein n=1 Tax=Qipengyuania sp. JC766 TaxID=3232139 RepID=UPI003458F81B
MPGFNFLFEAFILLMGLAMAEVLRGFARVLKLRARRKAGIDPGMERIHIGWLTPLLGLLVIVDQSTFFLHMYGYRDLMPFNGGTVLGILLAFGWYYLVASMTFPDEPDDWPDFDVWFWQQKRFVVGGVLGVNVLGTIATMVFVTAEKQQEIAASLTPQQAIASMVAMLSIIPMIWLFFSKSKRVCLTLLWLYIGLTVGYGMIVFTTVHPG